MIMSNKEQIMKHCENPICGAPLKTNYCEACGTQHTDPQLRLYCLAERANEYFQDKKCGANEKT